MLELPVFSSVQSLSHVWLFETSWIVAHQASLSITNSRCSTPGLPVHHQLQEFTQTHVHWISDAIQPSHPLLSPSPPAPNPSQHQGFFQWVNSWNEVAKVLEFQLQHQSFLGTCNKNTIVLLGDGPQHLTSKDNWKNFLKTNKKQQQK